MNIDPMSSVTSLPGSTGVSTARTCSTPPPRPHAPRTLACRSSSGRTPWRTGRDHEGLHQGARPLRSIPTGAHPRENFVAPHDERSFYVSVDPAGEDAMEVCDLVAPAVRTRTSSRCSPRQHDRRIATICEGAAWFRACRLARLTFPLALRKLRELRHRPPARLRRRKDGHVVPQGVLDELSLVLSPTVSGEPETASVFDEMPRSTGGSHAFSLERVERLAGDGLHLVYRVQR